MNPLFARKAQSSAVNKETFVDAMDALETYFALQKEVSARLSSGFWALAQTKYVMGAERVSPLAFPKRMKASRFVAESDDGTLRLTSLKPRRTKEASGSSEKPVIVLPSSSSSKADNVEGVSEQLRTLALQYDSLFAKDLVGEGEEQEEEEEDSPPASLSSSKGDLAAAKSPVRFFGNFVPPALRTAAEEFEAALQQALEALNARRKVEQALRGHASKGASCGE